ncbi:MAG: hypothetical protein V1650_00480 [Candidatus Omnitrophota bacterium]
MPKLLKFLAITAVLTVAIFSLSFADQSEQFTITTYYPSPYGSYKDLQLFPYNNSFDPGSCSSEGTMYYNLNMHQLRICNGIVWGPASGAGAGGAYWGENGNDIYNTNTGNVGIGTGNTGATPLDAKLVVNGKIKVDNSKIVVVHSFPPLITINSLDGNDGVSGQYIRIGKNQESMMNIVNTVTPGQMWGLHVMGGDIALEPARNSAGVWLGGIMRSSSLELFGTSVDPARIILKYESPPNPGDVLTAVDATGAVEWKPTVDRSASATCVWTSLLGGAATCPHGYYMKGIGSTTIYCCAL